MKALHGDEVDRWVAADAATVYGLVSDVTRTPEWSPEVVEGVWLDGADAPRVGARFRARNRRRWMTWPNTPVVEVADPGREFTVARTERGGGMLRWRYRLTPQGDGTLVALSFEVVRPVPLMLHRVLRVLFGVRDLQADLHANMTTSLERIAGIAAAECGSVPGP